MVLRFDLHKMLLKFPKIEKRKLDKGMNKIFNKLDLHNNEKSTHTHTHTRKKKWA